MTPSPSGKDGRMWESRHVIKDLIKTNRKLSKRRFENEMRGECGTKRQFPCVWRKQFETKGSLPEQV